MIQDLSGSWRIKGTGESTLVMDSPVSLMHHDPDRSWITHPDPDELKATQPKLTLDYLEETRQTTTTTLYFSSRKKQLRLVIDGVMF